MSRVAQVRRERVNGWLNVCVNIVGGGDTDGSLVFEVIRHHLKAAADLRRLAHDLRRMTAGGRFGAVLSPRVV